MADDPRTILCPTAHVRPTAIDDAPAMRPTPACSDCRTPIDPDEREDHLCQYCRDARVAEYFALAAANAREEFKR